MRWLFFSMALSFMGLVSLHVSQAQVMTSSNYHIQSDSINIGGGLSSSSNYVTESTAGEIATGPSGSSNYRLRSGYQQMQEVYLALSGGADVVMDSTINGIVGGLTNGSTTLTATTDSPSGYQLTIEASQSPAMNSGADSIGDYTPVAADPDLQFITGTTDSHLGYTPFGDHVVQRFLTNGSACNVSGSASSTACWDGLSTTAEVVSQSTSPNHPAGTDTTIYFRVGVGGSVIQAPGDYVATSTVTLLAL